MTAVCVAGMHRSGTSLFARTLGLCGLYLGDEIDMAPAALDNPEGYWENVHFLSLNDRILASLGGGWDLPPAAAPGWENFPEIVAYQVEARSTIQKLARRPHWGWKDPRTSLTMPFWRQLVPNLKVVICLRHPLGGGAVFGAPGSGLRGVFTEVVARLPSAAAGRRAGAGSPGNAL